MKGSDTSRRNADVDFSNDINNSDGRHILWCMVAPMVYIQVVAVLVSLLACSVYASLARLFGASIHICIPSL